MSLLSALVGQADAVRARITPLSVGLENKGASADWILQEFRLNAESKLQSVLELPMTDEYPFEKACKDRMRELYDRKLGSHGVRALDKYRNELFRWTWKDEHRHRHGGALVSLLTLAQELFRNQKR